MFFEFYVIVCVSVNCIQMPANSPCVFPVGFTIDAMSIVDRCSFGSQYLTYQDATAYTLRHDTASIFVSVLHFDAKNPLSGSFLLVHSPCPLLDYEIYRCLFFKNNHYKCQTQRPKLPSHVTRCQVALYTGTYSMFLQSFWSFLVLRQYFIE